ncbi:MAG: carbon-nitrogen hydrolase family protein [Actinomycetes bacterium]
MRAGVVQMDSRSDRDVNLGTATRLVADAVRDGAELVALPEMFNLLGDRATLRAGAEPLDGPTQRWAADTAREHGIHLVAGSMIEAVGDRRFNTSCVYAPDGRRVAEYRKLHLFDVSVPGAEFSESATVSPGDAVVVAPAPPLVLGLAICYDLRFPEEFRAQVRLGATAIALPSAFTAATGRDHWEPLLRTRAIENQCFVLAPDQCGVPVAGPAWHGHSLIVDPWGTVLAAAGTEVGHVVADLDLDRLAEVRRRLPALDHTRPEIYG